jgi:hypothetical protein
MDSNNNEKDFSEESVPFLRADQYVGEDHFICGYGIKFISALPEVNVKSEINFEITNIYDKVTLITPEGVFQWCTETKTLEQYLNIATINRFELNSLTNIARTIHNPQGIFIHELPNCLLTLQQLSVLDHQIVLRKGHNIFGYTVNEYCYILCVGMLFRETYPPTSVNYSRRLLSVAQLSIVRDFFLLLKIISFSLDGIYNQLALLYFDKDVVSREQNLADKTSVRLLYALCLYSVMCLFFFLRWKVFSQSTIFNALNLVWRIIRYMALPLTIAAFLPIDVFFQERSTIFYLLLPCLMFSFFYGYTSRDRLFSSKVLNIARYPLLNVILYGCSYALIDDGFFRGGSGFFIDLIWHLQNANANDDAEVLSDYNNVFKFSAVAAFILLFTVQLLRYPSLGESTERIGFVFSNLGNAFCSTLLLIHGLPLLTAGTIVVLNCWYQQDEYCHILEGWGLPFYTIVTFLSFIIALGFDFPTTPDLPMYSMRLPPEE